MKKKINGKKLLSLALAGVLSTTLLTGCGGGGSKPAANVEFDKNLIYKANYYSKPEELSYLGNIQSGKDGKIYAQGYSEKEGGNVTVQINPDNGQAEKTFTAGSKDGNSWPVSFSVDENGNFWQILSTFIMDEKNPDQSRNVFNLVQTDTAGKELSNTELKTTEENFYPNSMILDKDGNVIIVSSNTLYGYDKDGKEILKIESKSYIESAIENTDGTLYTVTYSDDYTERIFSKLDLAAKQLVEVQRMSNAAGMANLVSGKDGLYLNDGIFLYTYNIETNEKNKVLNWINSDINGSATYGLSALSDGRFVGNVYDELTQENQIMVVEKVQPEDVKDKKLVSLAMPYNDYNVNVAVISFNKQNEEYRIVVDDYSKYATSENYNAGAEKMNTDLISGKVPDLISIGNLAISNYTNKGLFMNLYEMMEKDSEFNREDYLENIFKAYEKDGKLYSVIPSFTVMTVIGKESNVGKTPGWTMEDLEKLMASKPEGTKVFNGETQDSILNRGLFLSIDQYINYSEGTCRFDDGEFIKLLNFAKQFPKDYDMNDGARGGGEVAVDAVAMSEGEQNPFAKDKVMLQNCYLYNYDQVHSEKYYNYGGSEITFIGFPTANKQGSAISGTGEIAMSAKAAYPDGAWAFIKYLLSDEYQSARNFEWPVKKSVYPALKEKAQKPDTYKDENGKEQIVENMFVIDGKEVKIGKVTDEEIKKVDELLNSVTQVMRYDTKVQEIITEESGAFFSGQKSAQETAKLIQNRVQTYLSESK